MADRRALALRVVVRPRTGDLLDAEVVDAETGETVGVLPVVEVSSVYRYGAESRSRVELPSSAILRSEERVEAVGTE